MNEYKSNFEDTTFIFSLTLIVKLACSVGDILLLKKSLLLLCPQPLIDLTVEERNSLLFSIVNANSKADTKNQEIESKSSQKSTESDVTEPQIRQTNYQWDDVVCGNVKEKIIIHKLYFNDSSSFSYFLSFFVLLLFHLPSKY